MMNLFLINTQLFWINRCSRQVGITMRSEQGVMRCNRTKNGLVVRSHFSLLVFPACTGILINKCLHCQQFANSIYSVVFVVTLVVLWVAVFPLQSVFLCVCVCVYRGGGGGLHIDNKLFVLHDVHTIHRKHKVEFIKLQREHFAPLIVYNIPGLKWNMKLLECWNILINGQLAYTFSQHTWSKLI